MPYLARSQANSVSTLALYAVDAAGLLYDPETVEFRVLDLLDSSEDQTWTDVTSDGRVDVGVFYAPHTPAADATVGAHRVEWRFTDSEDATVTRTWSQRFDVYTAGVEVPYWTYLSPNRVRDEGVDTVQLPDARLVDLIVRAQAYVERECRQPFRPVRQTVRFDGTGGSLFMAPIPIIGVEYLRVNRSTANLSTDSFAVYAAPALGSDPGWLPKDHRRNPKIALVRNLSPSPFTPGRVLGSGWADRFLPGAQAHEVKAVWGFVEPDGTTPRLIEDAMLRVVVATATLMTIGSATTTVAGPIVREQTDLHEIEYADPGSSGGGSSFDQLATSPEVQDIVRRYRAPIGLGSPATTWATLAR